MGRRLAVVAAVLACAGCSGSPSPSATPTPQVIARIGTSTITADAFQVRLQSSLFAVSQGGGPTNNAAMLSQVRASVLRSLIIDTVIAQEAAATGVAATDAEIKAQVDADTSSAGGPRQLQSRLAALGGSTAQLNDEIRSALNEQKLEDAFAKQRATEIEQKLDSGTPFAALASQYSDDTATAANGGEIGAVTRVQLQADDPAYVSGVLALVVGAHANPPIRDAQGYDIVEVQAANPTALTLRHIIVTAPQPYTVKERPTWFSVAIFETLATECTSGLVQVYINDVGPDPCAAATSPSPRASAQPSASPTH